MTLITDKAAEALAQAEADFKSEGGLDELVEYLQRVSLEIDTAQTPADFIEPGWDDPTIDVRLRYFDRSWYMYSGDSSYDVDHRGHWGASFVWAKVTRDECRDLAVDLLDQVLDSLAESID